MISNLNVFTLKRDRGSGINTPGGIAKSSLWICLLLGSESGVFICRSSVNNMFRSILRPIGAFRGW